MYGHKIFQYNQPLLIHLPSDLCAILWEIQCKEGTFMSYLYKSAVVEAFLHKSNQQTLMLFTFCYHKLQFQPIWILLCPYSGT